ncbi:MAG: DUF1054 family protein, partial [Firmicutes bacterium]|nr:DUF1054 family protein [Bacillota bacterium]
PVISQAVGVPMYAHVARHARRKTNPPNDSWVAFSQDPRGYKKWPTFMVGLWQTHVYVQFGVIYESAQKAVLGQAVQTLDLAQLREKLPVGTRVYGDYMVPGGNSLAALSDEQLRALAQRVQEVKKADLLFGVEWPRETVLAMSPNAFEANLIERCRQLAVLYPLAMGKEGATLS